MIREPSIRDITRSVARGTLGQFDDTPLRVPGVKFWIDNADITTISHVAGAVSGESDKSGNGYNVTQGTPAAKPITGATTLNSNNVLDFAGGDSLAAPSGLHSISNGANTIFAVAKRTVASGTQVIFATENGGGQYRTALFYSSAGQVKYRNDNGTESSAISDGNVTTDFNLLRGSYDGVSEISMSVNGETPITTSTGVNASTITVATIGSGSTGLSLVGSIAELIIYDRLLTANEISIVESYLTVKWRLPYILPYDVIALLGQSNMRGEDGPVDGTLDATDALIRQWGRVSPSNNKIILAQDPLDNVSSTSDTIGMGMTFAKNHLITMPSGRRTLLVPCAQGGTGFSSNNWNPGDTLYEDALARINAAMATNSGNTLTHMLWHQGEADSLSSETTYATALDAMIDDLRTRATGASTTPFMCGGTLVGGSQTAAGVTAALVDTPNRNANSYYLSADGLGDKGDNLHFSAAALRTFGQRYFNKTSEFNTTWINSYTADQQSLIRALDLKQSNAFIDTAANPILGWFKAETDYLTLSGTAITQMLDASGHSNNAVVQATGTARPNFNSTGLNSLGISEWDGGDELKLPSAFYSLANGANTVFAVVRKSGGATTRVIVAGLQGSSAYKYALYYASNDKFTFRNDNGVGGVVDIAGTTSDWNILQASYDGSTGQSIAINNGTPVTNANGVASAAVDNFAISETNLNLVGDIAEIIILDVEANAFQVAEVNAYLGTKYAITIS